MELSIIIVNYKVKDKLFLCLKSIYDSKPKTGFEIIVVDNDENKEIKNELLKKFPSAIYIESSKNIGYGGGNNLGASFARGEYLFFLNPDTQIIGDVITGLYKMIKANRKIGIVAPLLLDINKNEYELQGTKILTPIRALLSLSFFSKSLSSYKFHNDYYIKTWNKNGLREVDVCPGTAFMIGKKLFSQVGGFDEKFFLYFEEFDFCKRIRELGYKIYIVSKLKIIHEWGASTKDFKEKDQAFAKSRHFYFKKHYGFLKALFVEIVLRLNKYSFLLLSALVISLFLRLYNLSSGMTFIGDQGWFYLSARDLLLTGKIPLVGITSSHTWLHQGPLWTYMLSVMLKIFSFNPLSGAYLTVFFGTITVFLMYILGSQIFSRKVGIIACFLYMASPLIVQFDRMPYHTSPIPFFTLLYFFCFYKWLSGSTKYFPMILLSLAILYNLELATCVLVFPFALVFAYGCLKNKKWIKELLNRKIISFSLILPILIMFPVIIYDFSHGFKQTVVFLGWIIYKPFSFSISHSNVNFSSTFSSIVTFIAVSLQKLVFEQSLIISLLISFLSIIIIAKRIKIDHSISKMLLLFLLLISVGGIIVSQTPSDAYLPVIFPFAIFSIAILFDRLLKIQYLKYLAPALLLVILLANFYSSFNQDRNIMGLGSVMITVNRIIALSSGREYNLVGEGKDSQFSSFTMNYEYLLWWRGYAPSHKNVNLKIFVSESPVGYIVRKNND